MRNWRVIVQGIAGLWLVIATAAAGQSPPFIQCPAVGANSSCAVLIVFKPNGKPVVLTDPSQGPYDQIEDTLVGVQNDSNQTVFSISLSSDTDIFGFDGDGLCAVDPHPAGCPFGPTGYEGMGVSFAVQSVTAGSVNFANGIPPGGHAYFSLEEANFTLNLCGDNGTKIVEQISGPGLSCGPVGVKAPTWGSFGTATELVSDLGEKLELRCDPGGGLPSFHLYYTPPGGTPFRIGTCPFVSGCNNGWFSHAGKNSATGKPRCFIETYWRSRDYEENDLPNGWTKAAGKDTTAHEPVLDWAVTTYNAVTNNLTRLDYEFQYNPAITPTVPPVPSARFCGVFGGARPEGALVRTIDLGDPPLGPDTEAFFDRVFANLQAIAPPNAAPMLLAAVSSGDLNSDGAKNSDDFAVFRAAFGSCAGSSSFNPVADIDGDGCVTFLDYQLFMQFFSTN